MMKIRYFAIICVLLTALNSLMATSLFVEAESFSTKGGWVVDQQFMDQMGSPYILAHGCGKPVKDATTSLSFPRKGVYQVFVRTFNWTSPWTSKPGPGQFQLSVDGKSIETILGNTGSQWMWQKAGEIMISNKKNVSVTIHDLTGFDGRLDAIYFTTDKNDIPPADTKTLDTFRKTKLSIKNGDTKKFDLVVVGGGTAGICAAVAAGRQGLKVALIQNRPVLGGNNSSEVRVHLGGKINVGKYPNLGNMVREFGPSKEGNARDAENYEDSLKMAFVKAEKNVSLFLNYHAYAVNVNKDSKIESIKIKNIYSAIQFTIKSPLFIDCTGDGTIGYLAGADFAQGTEAYETYKENRAPKSFLKTTMGSSVQWNSKETDAAATFPEFEYGLSFNASNCEKLTMGEWTWETGMNYNQVSEFERVRDYGMLVVYSNWSFLKNHLPNNEKFSNRELNWVAFIAGKRESRRLLGDLILTQNDLDNYVEYEDGTASSTWTIDLHYPDPANSAKFPGEEFKSIANHTKIYPYPIPYRCLYSRNINNLLMAGRNISVSHIALGTVRVMRTTAMLGEVTGLAASVCKKHNCSPRQVYSTYLSELIALMNVGAGKSNAPDSKNYNVMENLKSKPLK